MKEVLIKSWKLPARVAHLSLPRPSSLAENAGVEELGRGTDVAPCSLKDPRHAGSKIETLELSQTSPEWFISDGNRKTKAASAASLYAKQALAAAEAGAGVVLSLRLGVHFGVHKASQGTMQGRNLPAWLPPSWLLGSRPDLTVLSWAVCLQNQNTSMQKSRATSGATPHLTGGSFGSGGCVLQIFAAAFLCCLPLSTSFITRRTGHPSIHSHAPSSNIHPPRLAPIP